jgi:uncharacterized protein (DUF1800 family)
MKPADTAQMLIGLTPRQKEMLAALQGSARMVAGETMQSRMLRDLLSERQLEAVMTDFWLNHFNVYVRKNQQEPYLLPTYERETIRPNALGIWTICRVSARTRRRPSASRCGRCAASLQPRAARG